MVKLFCMVVGETGSAFAINIDDANDCVGDLKDAIKVKQMYNFPAHKLQLFLAKKRKCTWLESSTDDVKKLRKGDKTDLSIVQTID